MFALHGAYMGVAWPYVREVCPNDSPVAIWPITKRRADRTTSKGLYPPGHDFSTFAVSLNINGVAARGEGFTKQGTF